MFEGSLSRGREGGEEGREEETGIVKCSVVSAKFHFVPAETFGVLACGIIPTAGYLHHERAECWKDGRTGICASRLFSQLLVSQGFGQDSHTPNTQVRLEQFSLQLAALIKAVPLCALLHRFPKCMK